MWRLVKAMINSDQERCLSRFRLAGSRLHGKRYGRRERTEFYGCSCPSALSTKAKPVPNELESSNDAGAGNPEIYFVDINPGLQLSIGRAG